MYTNHKKNKIFLKIFIIFIISINIIKLTSEQYLFFHFLF